MTRAIRGARPLLLFAACAVSEAAIAETIVVDDDGGPGVDFTDVPPAVAAASPGDLILVRPGEYSGFTVDKTLTVLGGAGVSTGPIFADGSSGAGPIVLAGFVAERFVVRDCASPVVLQGVSAAHHGTNLFVEDCDDVRVRGASLGSDQEFIPQEVTAVRALRSRIEVVESLLVSGGGGADCIFGPFDGPPGDGLFAEQAAVRLALSSALGGRGDSDLLCPDCGTGGAGGNGLRATEGSDLIVSGLADDEVRGGNGGGSCVAIGGPYGTPVILQTGSSLRRSGATLMVGCTFVDDEFFCSPEVEGCGDCTEPLPPDPVLELDGTAVPGGVLTFRLHGALGAQTRLFLGRQAVVTPLVGTAEDILTTVLRVVDAGPITGAGYTEWTLALPATLPPGFVFYVQGWVRLEGGDVRLTHSIPVVLHEA